MADAIPVHSADKPKTEVKKPEAKKPAKPAAQVEQPESAPVKGTVYRMPSGSICVDH
jgi:hypothetical protein